MRTRPLGKTGFEPSELALGTWGLSGDGYGPVTDDEVDRVLDRALELGVTLFDTADSYGRGRMEEKLGARLGGLGEKTIVVTKIGTDLTKRPRPVERFDPAFLRESVDRSRERLKRPKIDVVLLHNPTLATLTRGEATALMKQLVAEGAIAAWGVSAGDVDTGRAALAQGAAVLEVAYNALFSRDLHDLVGDVSTAGAGVLARSVLGYGLLTGHFREERTFPHDDHRIARWNREELRARLRQLDGMRPLVGGEVLTLRAAALRFVLANRLVSAAVLGPRTVPQLEQLVREAGSGPPYLSDEALARLPVDLTKVGAGS